MTKLSFSIVVPTYQRRDIVADAVRAVGRISYDAELEVIVVVDGSTDGTREELEQIDLPFPFKVIEQANAGASRARNAGARAARGDVLLFLDDDMMCAPDIVEEHAKSYLTGADAVLGDMPLDPGSPSSLLGKGVGEWAESRSKRLTEGGELGLFDLLTGHLSIRRSVFEAIGGFDEAFTRDGCFGNEDLDIGLRLIEHYRVVFNPRAVSHQRYVVGYRQNMRQWFQAGQADVEFARKHPGMARELFEGHGASDLATRRYFIRLGRITPLARGLGASACFLAASLWGKRNEIDPLIEWYYFFARDILYWNGVASRGGRPGSHPLLVLCYHSISDLAHDPVRHDYGTPRRQFEQQLAGLLASGYFFVRPAELASYLAGHGGLPRKAVLLTFDDCYEELAEVARTVLEPRRIPALFFAVSAVPSNTNEWDQQIGCARLHLLPAPALLDLVHRGIEIGSHSRTHRELPKLSDADLRAETRGAAGDLEEKGLPRPRFFAYPYGEVDARVASSVREAGYVAGFGLRASRFERGDDPMVLPRVEVLRSDIGWRFWLKTRAPKLAAKAWSLPSALVHQRRPMGLAELRATRFPELPCFCGKVDGVGVDETEEWRDWTHQETTPDQERIEEYLLARPLSGLSILHVGIGNSSLARRLSPRVSRIVGTTITPGEIRFAEELGLPNYEVFLHNKYSGSPLPTSTTFDIIVDNNITTFCCCLRHLENLMKLFSTSLAPRGIVITDRAGLNWVTSMPGANPRWGFDSNDLAAVASRVGLNVYTAGEDTYLMSASRPVKYLGEAPGRVRRAARIARRWLVRAAHV